MVNNNWCANQPQCYRDVSIFLANAGHSEICFRLDYSETKKRDRKILLVNRSLAAKKSTMDLYDAVFQLMLNFILTCVDRKRHVRSLCITWGSSINDVTQFFGGKLTPLPFVTFRHAALDPPYDVTNF